MFKKVGAQIGQDSLSGFLQNQCLKVGTDQRNDQQGGIDRHGGIKRRKRKAVFDHFLNVAHQYRRDHIVGNRDDHQQKYQQEGAFVGLYIPQKPSDDFAVFHAPVKTDSFFLLAYGQVCKEKNSRKNARNSADYEKRKVFTHGVPLLSVRPTVADQRFFCRQDSGHTVLRGCPHPGSGPPLSRRFDPDSPRSTPGER